jgi:hypothetical protein
MCLTLQMLLVPSLGCCLALLPAKIALVVAPVPAANITLSFSYPVELSQLAKSLKLVGSGTSSSAITISPCPTVSPIIPMPLAFTVKGVEGAGSSSSSLTDLLKLNSTCAVVKIVPGLQAGAAAVLRLPKGARYSTLAGPATNDININVRAAGASFWAAGGSVLVACMCVCSTLQLISTQK